jgi:hypothetical protein
VVVIGKVEAWWQWRFGQENRSDGEEKLGGGDRQCGGMVAVVVRTGI